MLKTHPRIGNRGVIKKSVSRFITATIITETTIVFNPSLCIRIFKTSGSKIGRKMLRYSTTTSFDL